MNHHDAVREALAAHLQPSRHTVQVTSFGGSGTTALCDHLKAAGADVPASPGHFPYKHQRVPPRADEVPDGFRVVYLFGDPRDAVLSVFRRGLQVGHYRGMRMRAPPPEAQTHLASIEMFLDAGVDEFELEDHFVRWIDHPRGYPVLFLRYEALVDEWEPVREFVGLPSDVPSLPSTARASDWQSIAPTRRTQITQMYAGLVRRVDALPPVHIG